MCLRSRVFALWSKNFLLAARLRCALKAARRRSFKRSFVSTRRKKRSITPTAVFFSTCCGSCWRGRPNRRRLRFSLGSQFSVLSFQKRPESGLDNVFFEDVTRSLVSAEFALVAC